MAKDVTLTDISGEKIYPKTYMKNVYDSSGQKTLEDKMVTTDTVQTITSDKYFNSAIYFDNINTASTATYRSNIYQYNDGLDISRRNATDGSDFASIAHFDLANKTLTVGGSKMATVTNVNNVSLLPDGTYSSGSITATGTKLTAPCNGYLFVSWGSTTGAGYIGLSSDSGIGSNKNIHSSGNYPTHYLPVAKGDVVTVTYTSSYTNNATYKFIKTKGV